MVDDCSTDETAAIADGLGATVLRPPVNTGSKAGAQMFALDRVETAMVMALDADTTLAPDAIELLLPAFDDSDVVAACGTVLPRRVESIWERGRYVEYMLAFGFFKRVQDQYGKPLISSGCFSIYRTDELRTLGSVVNADDGRGYGPHLDDLPGRRKSALLPGGGLLSDRATRLRLHEQAAAALVSRVRCKTFVCTVARCWDSVSCARPSRSPSGTL